MTRALRHQPVKPLTAACCTEADVTFLIEGTDAQGEPTGTDVRLRVPLTEPAVRAAWATGLASPRTRDLAWARNPECCECRSRITSPSECGLIETSAGPRVACKGNGCFIRALQRTHPDIQSAAAVQRAGGR